MVSILPSARSSLDVIGDMLGQNMSQNLPRAIEQASNRKMLQESLGNVKQLAQSGGSPLDITLAAMQAGAGIPGSERYMAQIIPMLQQLAMSNASQNAPMAGEQGQIQRDRTPIEPIAQRQAQPTFLNQPSQAQQNFPTAVGPQGGPGQVPQEATTGQKQRLLTPSERIAAARDLNKEQKAAGIHKTVTESLEDVNQNELAKKDYNEAIDKELAQRVEGQQTYGARAVDYLKKAVGENISPELEARFQKEGEEASKLGKSEADINALLASKAKKFGNMLTNIRKNASAPRIFNSMGRAMLGTYKDMEASAKDVRQHIQPLLNEGLWDTARLELQNLGYGKEEIEAIINPMDEKSRTILNGVPEVPISLKQRIPGIPTTSLTPGPDIKNVKDAILKLKEVNPNFSLLLSRKGLEDKGYDWRLYKDALNEMIQSGEIKFTDDQQNQSGLLDTPPLSLLEQILVPFTGR